ncbi:MAG: WecB/TagA/CpsF family glycosyltransferase [Armatimonadetes bacterium]|nr:WecB/TagA/CpsF family glycosyltransferase [Armatimonadota bacterium]MDW8121583.1 WecB/TagA/CpsF family glycosyltransferase [Armatimonadota bacterium]
MTALGVAAVLTALVRTLKGSLTSYYLPYVVFAVTLLLKSGHPLDDLTRAAFVLGAGLSSLLSVFWQRELLHLTFAALACSGGVAITTIKIPFSHQFVDLGVLSFPLSVGWLWLFSALFRFTARLPGLTGAAGLVSGLTFAVIVLIAVAEPNQWAVTAALSAGVVSLFLLGLPMETGGAASLGALLAMATIVGALKNTALLVFIVPALVLGVPILEVAYRLRSRFFLFPQRRSLMDVLSQQGVNEKAILRILVAGQIYLALLSLWLVWWIEVHFLGKLALMTVWLLMGAGLFWLVLRLCAVRRGSPVADFLGIPLSTLSHKEVLDLLEQFIQEGRFHQVVTSDTSSVVRAREDEEFREVVKKADLVTPDGIGVLLGARLLGIPVYERVSGVDLVLSLCQRGSEKGWRFYFLGGRPGVAQQAAENLKKRFPGLKVVGTHHGYFTPEEEEKVIAEIQKAAPDVLFVAMGIPKQEKWIARNSGQLQVPICIGVGGSLDVYAGVVRRAPVWVQRLGLEWLYRALREPHRFPRLLAIPRLLALVLKNLLATATKGADEAFHKGS